MALGWMYGGLEYLSSAASSLSVEVHPLLPLSSKVEERLGRTLSPRVHEEKQFSDSADTWRDSLFLLPCVFWSRDRPLICKVLVPQWMPCPAGLALHLNHLAADPEL